MKGILLARSSAGMSTSPLVTKMDKFIQTISEETKIWAVSQDQARKEMANADCVLIGPQMSSLKGDPQKGTDKYGIKIGANDRMVYGIPDGKNAYKQGLSIKGAQ